MSKDPDSGPSGLITGRYVSPLSRGKESGRSTGAGPGITAKTRPRFSVLSGRASSSIVYFGLQVAIESLLQLCRRTVRWAICRTFRNRKTRAYPAYAH